MKKFLLSFVALSFLVLGVSAQTTVFSNRNKVADRKRERTDAIPSQWQGIKPDATRNDTPLTDISSSINLFSVLVSQQPCLSYNPDLDALMFTNRGNTGVIASGNELVSSVSTDDGVTFSSEISLPDASILRRYPVEISTTRLVIPIRPMLSACWPGHGLKATIGRNPAWAATLSVSFTPIRR